MGGVRRKAPPPRYEKRKKAGDQKWQKERRKDPEKFKNHQKKIFFNRERQIGPGKIFKKKGKKTVLRNGKVGKMKPLYLKGNVFYK